MALPTVRMSFAASLEYKPPHPDRTARKSLHGLGADTMFKQWPSRGAMARTIRMQEKRESRNDDWRPCVRLTDTEGYY